MGRPNDSKSSVLHMWTIREKEYLRKITPGHHYKEIQILMNKEFDLQLTLNQIKTAISRYKFNTGFTGQFTKGNIPFNKGTHIGGWKPTQFKKGNIPVNHREVGSERISVDGYIEVKIAEPNKWRQKHKITWEKVKGPVPKGYVIIFGDGNKQNCDIDNLILVTRHQLLTLNKKKLIQNDAELTRTGVIIADLYNKISQRR